MRSLGRRFAPALAAGLALSVTLTGAALGLDWASPVRVTDTRPSELSSLHELAGTADALHLVHGRVGPRRTDDRVVHQRSTDGGASWSAERTLFRSTDADRVLVPNLAIVARRDLVVVTWRTRGDDGTSLWVRRSEDGGRSWQPRQLLAESSLRLGLGVPALTMTGRTVLAAWTTRANGRILLRRSADGARTWGEARVLGGTRLSIDCDDEVLDGLVGLGAWAGTVHLAWSDSKVGACVTNALRVRTSVDGGRTWKVARVASTQRTYGWPEVAVRGGTVLMTLQRPDGGLVVVRSRDGGTTFTERDFSAPGDRVLGAADVLLPGGDAAWLVYADIAYDGDRVATSRLRFRVSDDRGRSWSPGGTVVRQTDRLRQAANLAANGAKPVVVFQSGRVDGSTADILAVRAK